MYDAIVPFANYSQLDATKLIALPGTAAARIPTIKLLGQEAAQREPPLRLMYELLMYELSSDR